MTAEFVDDLGGFTDLVGQTGDGAAGLIHQIQAIGAADTRLLSRCRRVFGIVGDLGGGGGHLGDGGGDHGDLLLLITQFVDVIGAAL